MAIVRLSASMPSARVALAGMLHEQGHDVVGPDEAFVTDVWVVDLPEEGPLGAVLASVRPTCGLVVLSDDPLVARGLARSRSAGWACLPRDVRAGELDLAVRATEAALVLLDHAAAAGLSGTAAAGCQSAARLTPREAEVLRLVAEGLPNKGIARALGVTENTVKFHVASICAKLDARTRTEAVMRAARNGLLTL